MKKFTSWEDKSKKVSIGKRKLQTKIEKLIKKFEKENKVSICFKFKPYSSFSLLVEIPLDKGL